ncbi:MAG: stage 0 sporulation family protein [Oscillospiraceae bacterium]|nr:stage 0 sporulation family protein [Oscillospiraceae bacterium]
MTEVIGVRFRSGSKEYYFDPHGIAVESGQFVIVETSQGMEYAQCLTGNHEVEDEAVVQPLRPLIRVATENDKRTMEYNRSREKDAFKTCQKKIAEHGLDMKLVRVESNFDGSKIVFFFTSEGRVDFRELVRDLAGVFRARIELRQIGVRDEAKMLGGLGICGRPFCCAGFLDDFVPVSIKMAKTQNLSLNPTKISGTCGRLMCCLKYEQEAYEDAARRMPKNDSFVLTPDGPGNVCSVNLVRETLGVRLDESPAAQKTYRNCEVRVLRNGKGSREGIVIPDERPERYEKPREEEFTAPTFTYEAPVLTLEGSVEPAEEAAELPKRSSRSRRGGRGRRRGGEGKAAAPDKEAAAQAAEKKPAAEKKQSEKKQETKKPSEKKQAAPAPAPAAEKSGEDAKKPRRRHHRGGRGRRRPGGGSGEAKAE